MAGDIYSGRNYFLCGNCNGIFYFHQRPFSDFAALQTFQYILLQLQQQNVNRMHSSKPGLLGMAPHMPHNNVLLNPNMQVALLAVILASQIQMVITYSNTCIPDTNGNYLQLLSAE